MLALLLRLLNCAESLDLLDFDHKLLKPYIEHNKTNSRVIDIYDKKIIKSLPKKQNEKKFFAFKTENLRTKRKSKYSYYRQLIDVSNEIQIDSIDVFEESNRLSVCLRFNDASNILETYNMFVFELDDKIYVITCISENEIETEIFERGICSIQ